MTWTGPDRLPAVLLYGDSNTYGTDPTAGRGSGGRYGADVRWPDRLAEGLAGRWRVLTDARPGRCIPTLDFEWEDFAGAVERAGPIDLAAVMLGTNDYLSAPRPDPERTAARMESFLRKARTLLGATPVLVIAPPRLDFGTDRFYGPYNTVDGSLSRALERAAARAGAEFLDAGAWELPLTADGIHLSPAGHIALADHMLRYMTAR